MLDGKKTYLAAGFTFGGAICYAIVDWATTGNIDLNAVFTAGLALAMLFLRKGVKST